MWDHRRLLPKSYTKAGRIDQRPTHRVYAVKKTGGDKSLWTEIGAAWAHQDGKGFNVKPEFLPLGGAKSLSASRGPSRLRPRPLDPSGDYGDTLLIPTLR